MEVTTMKTFSTFDQLQMLQQNEDIQTYFNYVEKIRDLEFTGKEFFIEALIASTELMFIEKNIHLEMHQGLTYTNDMGGFTIVIKENKTIIFFLDGYYIKGQQKVHGFMSKNNTYQEYRDILVSDYGFANKFMHMSYHHFSSPKLYTQKYHIYLDTQRSTQNISYLNENNQYVKPLLWICKPQSRVPKYFQFLFETSEKKLHIQIKSMYQKMLPKIADNFKPFEWQKKNIKIHIKNETIFEALRSWIKKQVIQLNQHV